MQVKAEPARVAGVSHCFFTSILFGSMALAVFIPSGSQTHAAAPITSSGLNTQINLSATPPVGKVQYDITGGTRPGGVTGTNLFHSFGDFNVPTNNIANFLNAGSVDLAGNPLAAGLPTSNILGRINGGNPSSIFGMIQTNGPGGFPNANLFLMNPNGFLFGPNATINVGGMATFTTADYIRHTDNTRFNAVEGPADLLLTAAPVAAFGFLGNNPAAIAIQGSTLQVAQGQSLSLVGGNQGFIATDPDSGNAIPVPGGITMTGGKLLAPGGQINLASVAGPGEVSAVDFMPTSGMTMGDISLSQGALLDVSADAAGTVRIRGGQFVMDQATISADTGNANGAPVAIDVNVTGDISVSTVDVPALTARTTGSGIAGEIQISSKNMDVTGTLLDNFFVSVIDTHTSGRGKAGNVSITTTGNLGVTGDPNGFTFFIDSGTTGPGNGGDVALTKGHLTLENTFISSGDFVSLLLGQGASGSSGTVKVNVDTIDFNLSTIITDSSAGRAGDITFAARDIQMKDSSISTIGLERGGDIAISADSLVTNFTSFETDTVLSPGGGITVNAKVVELTNGSTLVSSTFGDGPAGDIHVTGTDHVSLLGSFFDQRPSGIFSNSFGNSGSQGSSGSVTVTTPRLEMTGGARINTTTATSGRGGDVTITATDSVSISGEISTGEPEPLFGLGSIHPSGISTQTVGSVFCSGSCGDAGNIAITTGSLMLGNSAQLNSGTSSTGRGGDISIHATDAISLSGTLSDGTPVGIFSRTIGSAPGSGQGGDITLTAGQSVTLSNGAAISASSTGPANAGNITINAGATFLAENSSVTTQAAQASGGNITVNATDMVLLTNSQLSASVLGGAGGGGNITIDPQFVILQNSQILAQAILGAGGNIFVTTGVFLPDANSIVDASSQFGVNGNVTIQSPISQAGGKIVPLSNMPLETTALLGQRCAALAAGGQFSSFVMTGRDVLPTEPGGWLASPLAAVPAGASSSAQGDGDTLTPTLSQGEREQFVSVRRLSPPGAGMKIFSTDWMAGCGS